MPWSSCRILAILGYLLTNWGLTVSHNPVGHSYHLRRGLLTTRETSIDDDRIRGVELGEPLGLRLAHGARLAVIVTGLNKKDRSLHPRAAGPGRRGPAGGPRRRSTSPTR